MNSRQKIIIEEKTIRHSASLQILLIVTATIFVGVFFTLWSMHNHESDMRRNLIKDAQLVGNSIDWRNVQKLTASEIDLELPSYARLKEQLSLVRSASPLCRFIYLMGRHEDGTIYFFVDSEPKESPDHSPPGQLYPEATTELKSVFILGKPVTEGPVSDEWGLWISAFVPLNDPKTGEILAILGMDIDAHDWKLEKFQALTIPVSVTIIFLILEGIYFIIRIRIERENQRLAKSREMLEQSEARYRQLVEHAPAGIYEVDLVTNRFISVNDVMSGYMGYTKEEMLNFGPAVTLTEESRKLYQERLKKISLGVQVPLTIEYKAITKEGKEFWILVHTQYFYKDEIPVRATGVIHDINERKLAEQALICAKEAAERSDKLKDAFIANISHELRTPLNSILGFSDLLPDMISEDHQEPAAHIFEIIHVSGKRLMRTVDMVLNFSRLQVGEFPVKITNVNLAAVIESLLKEFNVIADQKSLEIIFDNQCGNISVLVDEYCIAQAIYDLLDNAIKFTNDGFVKVTLSRNNNNEVYIEITDTGIGISKEYLQKLFQPFSQEDTGLTRAFEGIGLGLSIVKKLLDLIHAKISVESEKGQGTTFRIIIEDTNNQLWSLSHREEF